MSQNRPRFTGRYFLILNDIDEDSSRIRKTLEMKWGFTVAGSSDFVSETINENSLKEADVLFYNELGIALIGCEDEERYKLLQRVDRSYIIEPEKVIHLPEEEEIVAERKSTWGIEVTKAALSEYSGIGVKIAILDTGFDLQHPDFKEREITADSFVPDESVQDEHGHGTHCIGTACGSQDIDGDRYGVATNADIYVGKVLNNRGSGAQSWILNGITQAVKKGCNLLSMSFGSKVSSGEGYDIAYERAAQYALSKGTLLVAAAGNDSRRSNGHYSPVNSPADSPSIIAVAAIDSDLKPADFSNRSINPEGEIDIAAPGVGIYSSWPMPHRYRTISGTSMATPHVAGILALFCEKYQNAEPKKILEQFNNLAQPLPLSFNDVGAGLSIAP